MNRLFSVTLFYGVLALLLAYPAAAWAKLPIDLEVVTEPGVSITAPQQWLQVLSQMDLGSVRIRSARPGDRALLKKHSGPGATRFRLVAILNSRNQLILPRQRFSINNRQALKKHLEQLPVQAAYNAEERGQFGLTEKQFRRIYVELTQPVNFSTVGKTTSATLGHIEKNIAIPLVATIQSRPHPSPTLSAELKGLSTGTVLAIALRREGLMLVPQVLSDNTLQLTVALYNPHQESWPTGWKPEVSARKSAPQLYELRNIGLDNFTLSQALIALAPALKMPVVYDQWVLTQKQIETNKTPISLPKKRTYLKSTVDKLASRTKLNSEVRVDEQGLPFLWITRFGKNSRPAVE